MIINKFKIAVQSRKRTLSDSSLTNGEMNECDDGWDEIDLRKHKNIFCVIVEHNGNIEDARYATRNY